MKHRSVVLTPVALTVVFLTAWPCHVCAATAPPPPAAYAGAALAESARPNGTAEGTAAYPRSLVASLPAPLRQVTYEAVRYTAVSDDEATELMIGADAAVYFREWGELLVLASPDALQRTEEWRRFSETRTVERSWERAEPLGQQTLNDFFAGVARTYPDLDKGLYGRYLVKYPSVHRRPPAVRLAAASKSAVTAVPPVTARSVVLSEGWETDPWSRWEVWDDTNGQYTWDVTQCDRHSGSYSADAVRGGTAGSQLSCSAAYPNDAFTWLETSQCQNLQGAGAAFLEFYANVQSESGDDPVGAYFYSEADDLYYGSGFSGNFGGWLHLVFNLKQWYFIGDLTTLSCNSLAFIFESDSTDAPGFGARIDDVTIVTGAASGLSCSAAASTMSGPAPLTVNFTGTVAGASGAATYWWWFDDGGEATTQNPSHTFAAPGDYDVAFEVTDGANLCYSALHVSVQQGGGGVQPQPGTYQGTTSQGKPMSFTVNSAGAISAWSTGFACGGSSGTVGTTSSPACPVTNGSFSCGTDSCPSAGVNVKLMGTFNSSTSAAGTMNLAVRPIPTANCCTNPGVTWSATLSGGAPLAASASADVSSGQAPLTVHFTGSGSGGTPPYAYSWNFGDGSAVSTQQNPAHTYTSAGAYTAVLTVTDATSATATAQATVTVTSTGQGYRYLVPAIAHNPGAGQTIWRTDVAAASRASSTASLTLTYHTSSGTVVRTASLAPGATVEWQNIAESLFGYSSSASTQGCLEIVSTQPLVITSRTFNQTPSGTYGQYLPALTEAQALITGELGVLPHLRKNSQFRTNVGAVNLGAASCTVRIQLYNAQGAAVGQPRDITVAPAEWKQVNDIFTATGAGTQNVAYATAQVQTAGGKAWVYGSIADELTGDPTTIPMLAAPTGSTGSTVEVDDGSVKVVTTFDATNGIVLQQVSSGEAATFDGANDALAVVDSAPDVFMIAAVQPQAGTYRGATSQGVALEFDVDSSARVTRFKASFACTGVSGFGQTSNLGCQVTNGSFDCGSTTCSAYGVNFKVAGTFNTSTSGSGTVDMTVGLGGSSCCRLTGLTWTATLGGAPPPVSANASADVTSGPAPLTVHFTASGSGGWLPYTYSWNFGDGSATSTQQSPAHTYTTAGAYTAVVTVRDSASVTATASKAITVTGGAALTASAGADVTSGQAPLTVHFTGSASGGTLPYSYSWNFGDGSAASTQQNPTHTYTTAATYTATLTVHDAASATATASKTITVTGGAALSASASANVTSGQAPLTVHFTGSGSGGSPPYTYSWNFADGSAASTQQSPTHTYSGVGTYTAVLTVRDATSATATASVTITATGQPGAFRLLVPAVAHNPGVPPTVWRTDIAAVNTYTQSAALTLTFTGGGGTLTRTATLGPGAAADWVNVLESLFGYSSSANVSGVVEILSTVPILATARTYNFTASGTYGQYLPALDVGQGIITGVVGVLPQIKKNAAFRTNVGAINLGAATCTVTVTLHNAQGTQIGSPRTITLAAGEWKQENDIFAKCGAADQDIAYATVDVQPNGARAWVYASVADAVTGDPTTIPVLTP